MTIDKLAPSAIRQQTQAAGTRLVEQKAVTQAELDQLLKDPVLGVAERMEAAALIGALRARIETGLLPSGLTKDVGRFAKAIEAEKDAAPRLAAANDALANGAIDKALHGRITGTRIPLRAAASVFRAVTAAEAEVKRLTPLAEDAGPDTKAVLEAKLKAAGAKHAALERLAATLAKEDIYGAVAGGAMLVGVAAATLLVSLFIVTGQSINAPDLVHQISIGGFDVGALGAAALGLRAVLPGAAHFNT